MTAAVATAAFALGVGVEHFRVAGIDDDIEVAAGRRGHIHLIDDVAAPLPELDLRRRARSAGKCRCAGLIGSDRRNSLQLGLCRLRPVGRDWNRHRRRIRGRPISAGSAMTAVPILAVPIFAVPIVALPVVALPVVALPVFAGDWGRLCTRRDVSTARGGCSRRYGVGRHRGVSSCHRTGHRTGHRRGGRGCVGDAGGTEHEADSGEAGIDGSLTGEHGGSSFLERSTQNRELAMASVWGPRVECATAS